MKQHIPFKLFPVLFLLIFLLVSCSREQAGTTPTATGGPTDIPIVDTTSVIPPANTDGAETMFVPGGTYLIGSLLSDPLARAHELPQHAVILTGFNIYTHEVTNAMYQDCANSGACLPVSGLHSELAEYSEDPAYADYPVVGVDWFMARDYCRWASGRLPTEAEWEAAARGSDARVYPWGNTEPDCTYASLQGCNTTGLPGKVGSFANGNSPFKVWDMSGNVWEWVNDWYEANSYASSTSSNPLGPWSSEYKVARGGGWNSPAYAIRTTHRTGVEPGQSFSDLGFRCIANGLPGTEDINLPEESHESREGGSGSLDDPARLRTEETTVPPRIWRWTRGSAICQPGRTGLLTLGAWNNFGGTYTGDIDGTAIPCSYDAISRSLTCTWPLGTPGGGSSGMELYIFTAMLKDASGNPVEGGTIRIGIPASSFVDCSAETGSGLTFTTGAFCGSDNRPYMTVESSFPFTYNRLSGDVSIDDPASACSPFTSSRMVCPLDTATMGTTLNTHIRATTLDGVTTLEDWALPAVSVPDCSSGPGSGNPVFTAAPGCTETGLSGFHLTWEPRADYLVQRVINDSTGFEWRNCISSGDGFLWCQSPAAGLDGQVHVSIVASARSPLPTPATQSLSFAAATCVGDPSSGILNFGPLSCSPVGLSGLVAQVNYTGTSSRVTMITRVNEPSGEFVYGCTPGSTSNIFNCPLNVPLADHIEFCYREDGGTSTCVPSPYSSVHVPARCGGTTETDRWNLGLSCGAGGGGAYQASVTLTGGRSVSSMTAVVAGTNLPCTANPAAPGTFTCNLPISVLANPPEFVARFTDGVEENHTFENFTSLLPAECSPGETPHTPGGGVCADLSVAGWQNPNNHFDVNNDGCVTPRDTLILIQNLNEAGGAFTPALPRPSGAAFLDVGGDGGVSALDVLMVIQYLNDHVGEACTSACSETPVRGDWTLDVYCNSATMGLGWTELRAFFPGERSNVTSLGQSYPGCSFNVNPAGGFISQYCRIGTDLSAPMVFWAERSDGSISQHTFTNVAELASICGSGGTEPVFQATATCSTTNLGAYDVSFNWTPPEYEVYSINNELGQVLSSCGICSGGTCQCTGLTPGTDGLIHVNMNNRTGPTEVNTPLVIAPPTCGGSDSNEWNLTAECDPAWGANGASIHLTYPNGLSPDLRDIAGMLMCTRVVPGNTANCGVDLARVVREPLTLRFLLPPDYTTETSHTFAEYATILPASCGDTSGGSGQPVVIPYCSGETMRLEVSLPTGGRLNSVSVNGEVLAPPAIIGLGTANGFFLIPPSMMSAATIRMNWTDAAGLSRDWSYGPAAWTCGGTSEGWRLGNPACAGTGYSVNFNLFYPETLDFSTVRVEDGSTRYTCAPWTSTHPYYLACYGTAHTPGTLQVEYTTTSGSSSSVSFPEWASRAPAFCPTPVPPSSGGNNPPSVTCSNYNNDGLACSNAGCVYWANMSCNPGTDPCHKYDGDGNQDGCKAAGCLFESKNMTCNTP